MKKLFISFLLLTLLLSVGSFWYISSEGYDRQNNLILFLKKIIPPKIARDIREKIFFIPNLQQRNKFLSLQVEKYEQGLNGKLFKSQKVKSSLNKEFEVKEFFLPFPRLDIRLGWAATENSKRAHYLEIIDDKVLVISGLGQTIFFDKNNLNKEKLNQINIPNNIENLLSNYNYKLIGIRDLFEDNGYIYISLLHKDDQGFTINIYKAKLSFDNLVFKEFFKSNEYWQIYNVFSGGRIERYKDNRILFSIGYSGLDKVAQKKDSLLGKIISIDKETGIHELVSLGHRNPQGLFYDKSKNLIFNTEHGPKGGDELNVNDLKNTLPNFGWDIASYGSPYKGEDNFKKSHKDFGFVEPFKNYTPSIGISEVVYLPREINPISGKSIIFISSLRAGSIYMIETDKSIKKILTEDRLFFKEQRIRDIEYDDELKLFLVLFEYTPSIGTIKYVS